MSHIQAPPTLPKHPQLLHEINDLLIRIKIHNSAFPTPEMLEAQKNHKKPTWAEIVTILEDARNAINEQREDPRKY